MVGSHLSDADDKCSVGTGYGQRPSTLYDWTLEPFASKEIGYQLPDNLSNRVQIEKLCDRVTKSLYSNRCDPVGLTAGVEKQSLRKLLAQEFEDLKLHLGGGLSGTYS